jgi:hypothetical protein
MPDAATPARMFRRTLTRMVAWLTLAHIIGLAVWKMHHVKGSN